MKHGQQAVGFHGQGRSVVAVHEVGLAVVVPDVRWLFDAL